MTRWIFFKSGRSRESSASGSFASMERPPERRSRWTGPCSSRSRGPSCFRADRYIDSGFFGESLYAVARPDVRPQVQAETRAARAVAAHGHGDRERRSAAARACRTPRHDRCFPRPDRSGQQGTSHQESALGARAREPDRRASDRAHGKPGMYAAVHPWSSDQRRGDARDGFARQRRTICLR